MTTKGSCACGAIAYQFEGEALAKALCHCIDCQKVSVRSSTRAEPSWQPPRDVTSAAWSGQAAPSPPTPSCRAPPSP
ncbi:hypothetical protein HYQ46_002815 [Verticillium longisporum]|nr:hypothetical protein HYQ46_002815 [Verticillium longisporum]